MPIPPAPGSSRCFRRKDFIICGPAPTRCPRCRPSETFHADDSRRAINAPTNEQHRTQRARRHGPDRHAAPDARRVDPSGPGVDDAGLPGDVERVERALCECRWMRCRPPRVHASGNERRNTSPDANAASPVKRTASFQHGPGLARSSSADGGLGPATEGHQCGGSADSKPTPQRLTRGPALQLPALACSLFRQPVAPIGRNNPSKARHGRRAVRAHVDVSI